MRLSFTEDIIRNIRKSWIMLMALSVLCLLHYIKKTFLFEGFKNDVEFIP